MNVAVLTIYGERALLVSGVEARGLSQRDLALIELLLDNRGRIVPYERFVPAMNLDNARGRHKFLHSLRTHVWLIKKFLRQNQIAANIATADFVGYALCEVDGR
jgi:DNA-binding response OmpR family regulator